MAANVLNLFSGQQGFEVYEQMAKTLKSRRIHYKKPTYTKSYTFYHTNPESGEIQYDGDEKHIFRIKTLHRLYSIIYGYCDVNLFENFERIDKDGLTIWGEDKQAEIKDSCYLPLKKRVKMHIRLLRYLRKGFSVEESLEKAKGSI